MEFSVQDELYARAIGWRVLDYLRREHPGEAAKEVGEMRCVFWKKSKPF